VKLVDPNAWQPIGVPGLEPAALKAVRSKTNAYIVAGPGAGKTELLAQRATYLLQTGTCTAPQRILAISFKRDAAENLAARVRKRCPVELSSRFASYTFDAFTKTLVDRFAEALPPAWRPTHPYDIILPKAREVSLFLRGQLVSAASPWQPAIAALQERTFESITLGSRKLKGNAPSPSDGEELVVWNWWKKHLGARKSVLSFVMLNRLAELVVRSNAELRRALTLTYPFVFVDEFQDTTYAQFDFLQSVFWDPAVTVTVVGDNKQRIMLWAGARIDAFDEFGQRFGATRIDLLLNYRSTPGLVKIQQVFASALDAASKPTESKAETLINGDCAQIWSFTDTESEASQVALSISEDISKRGTSPREYAILVRQKADAFEADLSQAMADKGLSLRNESRQIGKTTLQDLLAERLTEISISLLRLVAHERDPDAWKLAIDGLSRIRQVERGDDEGPLAVEHELEDRIRSLRTKYFDKSPDPGLAEEVLQSIFEFIDLAAVRAAFVEYEVGDNLSIAVEAFEEHWIASAENATTWASCVEVFAGTTKVPLMTVHKSKGLEYDTIFFLGLDDANWWSYQPGDNEGRATFFVALSRAKQRAIFTFCSARGSREKVADLFQLLADAGVGEHQYPPTEDSESRDPLADC